jgi:hypothetical protein
MFEKLNKIKFLKNNSAEKYTLRKYTASDFHLLKDTAEEGDVVAQFALGDIYGCE